MDKPTVMVALRDAEHVGSLVKLACEMSNGMKSDLIALHVVEVAPGLPLDADAEILDRPAKQVLSLARKAAAENFFKQISTRLVRAREVGRTIVDEAREQRVELLIMGYHHKHDAPDGAGLSKGMKADLIAVHLLEVIPALPFEAGTEVVDRKNKEILARARQIASQNSFKHISTELIRAHNAGDAIIKNAREHGADLIILGCRHRHG